MQRCKGTRDFTPEEMQRFRAIESAFRDCCLKWGYGEVKTPTLEYLHLFTSSGTLTPSRLGRVYSFLDWDGWSGERVVLRPDGTIPIARMFIDDMPGADLARLFYVANVFIFESTGAETREKWQCGAELIGPGSSVADTELVLLSLEVLKKLGLKNVELKLSHAGLIRALLARYGLSASDQARVFDQLLDGDESVLAETKSEKPELGRSLAPLLELKGKSSGFLKNLKAISNQDFPEMKPALDGFIALADLLESVGVKYQIDIASGRGFEYYTGVMFKLLVRGEQVGGGGRYDSLIPQMGGREIPASGFALYIDQLMELVKPPAGAEPDAGVLIKAVPGNNSLKEAFQLAGALHDAGLRAEVHPGGAEPAGFGWLVEVGDAEPRFRLTDLSSHASRAVASRDELLSLIKH